jgi:hypothetical protein
MKILGFYKVLVLGAKYLGKIPGALTTGSAGRSKMGCMHENISIHFL